MAICSSQVCTRHRLQQRHPQTHQSWAVVCVGLPGGWTPALADVPHHWGPHVHSSCAAKPCRPPQALFAHLVSSRPHGSGPCSPPKCDISRHMVPNKPLSQLSSPGEDCLLVTPNSPAGNIYPSYSHPIQPTLSSPGPGASPCHFPLTCKICPGTWGPSPSSQHGTWWPELIQSKQKPQGPCLFGTQPAYLGLLPSPPWRWAGYCVGCRRGGRRGWMGAAAICTRCLPAVTLCLGALPNASTQFDSPASSNKAIVIIGAV